MKQMICAAVIALTLMFAFPVRIQAAYALAEPEEPGTQTADFTQNGTQTPDFTQNNTQPENFTRNDTQSADFTQNGTQTVDFTQEQSAYITDEPADFAQPETVSPEPVPDAEAVPDSVSGMEATPEDVPDSVPENALENVPENAVENVPENALENVPEDIPENVLKDIPESVPENRSAEKNETSADVPDSIYADDTSISADDASIYADYAEVTPEDVPENSSAAAIPENVPETAQAVLSDDEEDDEKYYNVTVENGTGSGFYREGDTRPAWKTASGVDASGGSDTHFCSGDCHAGGNVHHAREKCYPDSHI